jgi:GMP synthase-like glutamine amidotransferase
VTATALVLQTCDDRPAGLLGAWASARGVALDLIRADRWSMLPDPADYLFAVALSSHVSLADPWPRWATNEIDWIRRAHESGVPVLGIGFGAQALAVALGGSVQPMIGPRTGWIQIETRDPGRLPAGPWLALRHGRITPPEGADELAGDESGPLAFAVGRHLGLGFHPEATHTMLTRWLYSRHDRDDDRLSRERLHRAATLTAAIELFDTFAISAGLQLGPHRNPAATPGAVLK